MVVPGEGTYTVDPQTGKVTFTPEPGFTGPGTGVTVKATYVVTNENGEEAEVTATATYTPTVTPITPTAEPRETSGPQGKAQKTDAKTMFTEGDEVAPIDNSTITLLDAEGNPTKTVTVENEGTYTLNDDGTITFQPEPSFVGKGQGVRVQAADKNGTKVSDTYTPTVTPVSTTFVDEEGNTLSPTEGGKQPSKEISDYALVSSTTDENGDTVHVYRKIVKNTTSFVDENGNPIVPNEEGNQPSKDLPEYELVSSTTDENGNTVHTYRKVSKSNTSFVDEEGNPLAPQEDGKQPSKTISGYEIVSSTTDENGNVVHTY
ncbi:Ig-like domain-containing protein, partial [Streptococcus cuniculipharyngis]|uniref:Ig-like domain-containing protein n=1 Tax=Streptococcus cuniculipharyngis TaxID=1562651 RepID=UPI003CCC65CB